MMRGRCDDVLRRSGDMAMASSRLLNRILELGWQNRCDDPSRYILGPYVSCDSMPRRYGRRTQRSIRRRQLTPLTGLYGHSNPVGNTALWMPVIEIGNGVT